MNDGWIPELWSEARDQVALVRRLADAHLLHNLDERFLAGHDNSEAVRAMAAAGLLGLTLPPHWGGQGRSYTTLAAVCEELGRIDTTHQISVTVHLALAAMCILQWGSDDQRDAWLPALARGERLATLGLTEPGAGSDVAALRMRARRVERGWSLSGEKSWISAANQATLMLIVATVDPAQRHRGITAFIVPRESAGLSTTVLSGKHGVRAGDTGTVVCHDVFVPDEQVLGEIGEGFPIALSALGNGLFTVGCGALGVARAAREWTTSFLRERGDDGRGWEAGELARMIAREEAARMLLARAAWLKDRGQPNGQETGLAKWQAAEASVANANAALRIWSAHAPGEHPALLRHAANAKGAVIYGGTSEIHQTMQAAYALGQRVDRPFRRPSPTAAELAGQSVVRSER